ncbi:MAG TPA: GNAT family N-acetyltransferase [Thermomicrobiales bacterium]|nr:GNAT family N-acetyltransferase [Thermomicrobiales bacterium]
MAVDGMTLRNDLRTGDLGWIVERHGVLYADEFGWNIEFEAVVAEIIGHVVTGFDPSRERAWIAERDGRRLGSIFLEAGTGTTAKLRLMLVEPDARGLGLGTWLVDECVQFAREAGYSGITLWTMHVLVAARHIYERAGFQLVAAEPGHYFGNDLVSETWEIGL